MQNVLTLVLGLASVLALHELGHWLVGRVVGENTAMRWRSLRVTSDFPPEARLGPAAFWLAGPFTNLAVGASLSIAADRPSVPFVIALAHLAFGALNLLPFPRTNDGANVIRRLAR